MSTKEYAVSLLASLSEEKMLEFIKLFADENMLARMESDMLLADPDTKKYSCFREFMDEAEQTGRRCSLPLTQGTSADLLF